jgi:type I restriction enzyme R subunit
MVQPEEHARQTIDQLLGAAGWRVCDPQDAHITAHRGVAIREFPLKSGHGFADYLLYVDGMAAGVIEAKKAGTTLSGVEIQSNKYSKGLPDGLPAWRKPLPFAYQSTGAETRFTNGLDPAPRSRPVFAFHKPEMLAEWLDTTTRRSGLGREPDDLGNDFRGQARSYTADWQPAGVHAAEPSHPMTLLSRLRYLPALKTEGLWPAQITAINNLEQSLKETGRSDVNVINPKGVSFMLKPVDESPLSEDKRKRISYQLEQLSRLPNFSKLSTKV